MIKLVLDPNKKFESALKIDIRSLPQKDGSFKIDRAISSSMFFEGFEKIFIAKSPLDIVFLTQRICGVCPIPHGIASSLAVESALRSLRPLDIPEVGKAMRNIILALEHVISNIYNFYNSLLRYYIDISDTLLARFLPLSFKLIDPDFIKEPSFVQKFEKNYLTMLQFRELTKELLIMFSGKIPLESNIVAGGIKLSPSETNKTRSYETLKQLLEFVENIYFKDLEYMGQAFENYKSIGLGLDDYITFGMFENIQGLDIKEFKSGTLGEVFEESKIEKSSFTYRKEGLLAENFLPKELGAIARVKIGLGRKDLGASVFDRYKARFIETNEMLMNIKLWFDFIYNFSNHNTLGFVPIKVPNAHIKGSGLTEATRGALGHWISLEKGRVTKYKILTPTHWNMSTDGSGDDFSMGNFGPIERALEGTTLKDIRNPVEALRIIYSFAPCVSITACFTESNGTCVSKFDIEP